MLFYQAVPENLLRILRLLMQEEKLKDFQLVGGTALALQIGHRISVDIDLFTDHSFDSKIAAFKLDAITTRKAKKDFYDLWFLLKKLSLAGMINAYKEKYPYNSIKNVMVALSSCTAADKDEQPELMEPVEWDKVKTMLINEIQQYEKNIITQKKIQMKERENNIKKLVQKKKESGNS